jgi:isorenieratene synthase
MSESSTQGMQVVVVGGGLAGLTAATELARAGASVTLVEREPVAGGRLATPERCSLQHLGQVFDFPIEHGIHGIWRQYRNLRRLLDRHGLSAGLRPAGEQALVQSDPGERPLHMRVGEGPRRTRLPEPFNQLALFGDPAFLALALRHGPLGYLEASVRLWHAYAFDPARDLELYDRHSVADLIGTWPLPLRRLFASLTHTGFFREPNEVSLSAFFTGLSLYVLGDKRDSDFSMFDEDSETAVVGPLRSAIESAGGRVLLGTTVREILLEAGRAAAVRIESARGTQELHSDAVVLALDPPGLRGVVQGELSRALGPMTLTDGVASQSVRIWFAASPRADRAPSGVFVSGSFDAWFWLHRMQRPYREFHEATGGSCIECHLYGDRAAAALEAPDEQVTEQVAAAVERAWPELRGTRLHGHVRRNPATHVAFGPGIMARLPGVATSVPNLALCGDHIDCGLPVLYLERAVVTGLLAARQVAPQLGLPWDLVPAPLDPFPSRPNVSLLRRGLRRLRERGLFPAIGRA